jgi:hypothetical protein
MPNTLNKLTEEFDFDAAIDGWISMGPIRGHSVSTFERKMKDHGVFAFTETCELSQERRSCGNLYLTAISEDVMGFLFDEDGIEASSSDLENFLVDVLTDAAVITVRGSYPDGQGGIIMTEARYMRRGDEILRDVDRKCYTDSGETLTVMNITEVRDHELSVASESTDGAMIFNLDAFRAHRSG